MPSPSLPPDSATHGRQTVLPVTTPADRLMVTIIVVALAAGCLLISAGSGGQPGQKSWQPGSALRVITELLTLNHQYPTPRGAEIKWLAQGLGAAAALLAAAYAWTVRARREDDDWPTPATATEAPPSPTPHMTLTAIAPASAAQIALILFTCWVFLSVLWAPWPEAAFGEGVRQLIGTVWAVAIARTLGTRAIRFASGGLITVLTVTAILGIWYYFERSPDQRLGFPIGNPIFLGACLIPGITLATAAGIGGLICATSRRRESEPPARVQVLDAPTPVPLWIVLPGAVIALLLMLWAMYLTDSRGPVLGLLLGIAVAAFMALHGWSRRLLGIAVLIGIVAVVSLRLWPVTWIEGRPDTIRFRLYAWGYAGRIFLERPDIGRGQGAYVLQSQELALPDAEQDPPAFQGSVRGHAHNEWLEILADLGAIGFALMVTVIGLTLWSAGVALSRAPPQSWERWILIGLVAGFVGILIAEATDVGLRRPGLPLVFYTVVGLLWAAAHRQTHRDTPIPRYDRVVRGSGFAAAAVLAAGIAWYTAQDWQGSLAEQAVRTHEEARNWDRALQAAERARKNRLTLEGHLGGAYETVRAARNAAAYDFEQIIDTARRDTMTQRRRELIIEDAQHFQHHAELGLEHGLTLWQRMPYYPNVAGYVADLLIMAHQLERIQAQLGLREAPKSYEQDIYAWLTREHLRDRLDTRAALQLLEFSGHRPLPELIDLIRRPLRRGRFEPELENALTALLRHPSFGDAIGPMLQQALEDAQQSDPTDWQDDYAPEALRLAARAYALNDRFREAAQLAGNATGMLASLRDRFPTTASYAHLDRARYLLHLTPDQPGDAVRAAEDALEAWPAGRLHADERAVVIHSLAAYLLADGREDEARSRLREQTPGASIEAIDRQVAQSLNELCRRFIPSSPERRPAAFGQWLERAMHLAPEAMSTQETALLIALQENDADRINERLRAIETLIADPARFAAMLQALASRYEDHPALRDFIETWNAQRRREATAPTHAPEDDDLPPPDVPGLRDLLPEFEDEPPLPPAPGELIPQE